MLKGNKMGKLITLERRLTFLLEFVLMTALLAVGIVAVYYIAQTEDETWQSRQREAASGATKTVSSFLLQSQNTLTHVGLLEAASLAADLSYLQKLLDNNPVFIEIVRVDAQGNVFVYASQDQNVLADLFTIGQSRWFLEARAQRMYLGSVQFSTSHDPYLIMAVPSQDGGAVAARISMTGLWNVVNEIQFGENGKIQIVEKTGRIVAHKDLELVISNMMMTNQHILQASSEGWYGTYTNTDDNGVVGLALPIPETPWIVLTEIPRAEANKNSRVALLILGGGLALVGLGAMMISRVMLRQFVFLPLRELRAGTERLRQNELTYRLTVHRQDEIGRLAQDFNAMAASLHQHESDLQSQASALRIATAKAKEAARLRSEFLANMSHELRTPLNAIMGFSDMLLAGMSGELNSKQRHKIERLRENGHRLLNLINNVLDLTRIEARRIELVLAPFSPHDLCHRLSGQMEALAAKKNLQFRTIVAPDLPESLAGDEQRIEQIVVNLLSNAFKFTEAGSVTLHASVDHYQRTWSLSVADTGIGIPPHARDVIFEEFRQVDGSSTRAYKGSGLGLAIARNLVRIMDGQIAVQSELGSGSTFIVSLPLIEPVSNVPMMPELEAKGA
jgi:signal transduction histidine kinase